MWRRVRQVLYVTITLTVIGVGAWGVQRWRNYPKVPDLKTAKIDDALAFIGTDDFNRMFESHRRRYAIAVAERMREKSFGEVLAIFIRNDPGREKRWKNLRAIPDHEQISDAYIRLFLDKFFEESPTRQQFYLVVFAGFQQTEIARHPEKFGLPSAKQLKHDMGTFFSHESPRVQAQMGQFMTDLKAKREAMGLKDPF